MNQKIPQGFTAVGRYTDAAHFAWTKGDHQDL
jgi:hypothetical protein